MLLVRKSWLMPPLLVSGFWFLVSGSRPPVTRN
jgi:hypothetical protein